jgi:hypothetical protein
MFFGNIGNSLHHQIPPNWSSGLQIGPRFLLKASVPFHELSNKFIFQQMNPFFLSGNLDNLPTSSFFDKMASFFMYFLGPMWSQAFDIHGYPCHGYRLISMDVHESL